MLDIIGCKNSVPELSFGRQVNLVGIIVVKIVISIIEDYKITPAVVIYSLDRV